MSFGGSNPPWQRNTMGNAGQHGIPSLQSQMGLPNPNIVGFQNNQSLFNSNMVLGGHPQTPSPLMANLGGVSNNINSAQIYNQNVSYPSRSGGGGGGGNCNSFPQSNNNSNQSNNQTCNKIGVVTKLHSDYGFVDEEVFFHKNTCKGTLPKLGDRVLVEATCSPNTPFKWTATRVQLVGSGGGAGGGGNNSGHNSVPAARNQPVSGNNNNSRSGSGYNAVPPPNAYAGGFDRSGQPVRSRNLSPIPRRNRNSSRSPDRNARRTSRGRNAEDEDRKRRREDRERDRVKDKRDYSAEKRDPSQTRRDTQNRGRVVPRYMVQVPKVTLNLVESDVLELKRRYANLYIPLEFFFTKIRWSESFTPDVPFSIQKPCAFHIKHRSVDSITENTAVLDPPDANYLFSAKVMLMGIPPINEVYRKCFSTAEEKHEDNRSYVHPTRLINFLVGLTGKDEAMAIGGPWSPSLDGLNPDKDPSVLIKTAIRTCMALTGIDLTPCTQWYRFVELYYRVRKCRTDTTMETHTVVIFLPDIRSCVPTRIEWDALNCSYRKKMECVIRDTENENSVVEESTEKAANADNVSSMEADADQKPEGGKGSNETDVNESSNAVTDVDGDAAIEKEDSNYGRKSEPTNYALLDPKTMRVSDLRDELELRKSSSKGFKPQLVARLSKLLKSEEAEANQMATDDDNGDESASQDNVRIDDTEMDMRDIVVIDEYDSTKPNRNCRETSPKKEMEERERRLIEKRYELPEQPQIIVHPSRTAKSGKFFCDVMSLSILLDYRPEDSKKHSFEVSLFAELFNEMLMRDFGFNIYKSLFSAPEKAKEPEKNDKDKDKHNNGKKDERQPDDQPKEKKMKIDESANESDKKEEITKSIDHEKEATDKNIQQKTIKDKPSSRDKTERSSGRRRRDDETDDDNFSIKSSDPKKGKKITTEPDLLLSFVYFDQTHCGYIFEKDIESLFYTLGLNLSRAQVRKVIGKVVNNTKLYYRDLTDKPIVEKSDVATPIQDTNDENTKNSVELYNGNKILLPVFNNTIVEAENVTVSTDKDNSTENTSGIVSYKGGLFDIEKLIEQMKRSEKARDDTEQILADLRKNHSDVTASNVRSKERIKDLQSDVKVYTRKLADLEQSLSSTNKKNSEYYFLLSTIYDRISPVFTKPKTESSRDKDKDTREKRDREDRDKDKDKEREKERKDKDKEKERENKDQSTVAAEVPTATEEEEPKKEEN